MKLRKELLLEDFVPGRLKINTPTAIAPFGGRIRNSSVRMENPPLSSQETLTVFDP